MENIRKIRKIQPLENVGSYIANLSERCLEAVSNREHVSEYWFHRSTCEAEELPGQVTGVHLCGLSEAPVDSSSAEGVMER